MKQNANTLPLIRHARRAESEDDESSLQPLNWRDFQSKHSSRHPSQIGTARKNFAEMNTASDHMGDVSQSDHDDDSSVQTFELSAQEAVDAEDYIVRSYSNPSYHCKRQQLERMKQERISVSRSQKKKSPASVPARIQVQNQPSKIHRKPPATVYRENSVSRPNARPNPRPNPRPHPRPHGRSNFGVDIDHDDDLSSLTAGTANSEDVDRRLSMQRNFLEERANQFTKEDLEAIELAIAEECSIEQQRQEKIRKSENSIQHSIALAHLWIDNDPNERRRNFGKQLSTFELEALGAALAEASRRQGGRRQGGRNSENHTI